MTQARGLKFLLNMSSRKSLRTLIIFTYFVIFQSLILFQKPFLQFEFIEQFYSTFILLFGHHFLIHYVSDEVKYSQFKIASYFFDFIIMIYFMKSFPQLSSFLLVLQLFMLFIASFDINFLSLCALGFFASLGTSIMNLATYQAGSTQSILSLSLFNLSYLAVIVISGQIKDEIFTLQSDLSLTSKKLKTQAEFSKTLVQKMPLGLIVSNNQNEIALENSYLKSDLSMTESDIHSLLQKTSEINLIGSHFEFNFETQNQKQKKIFQLDRTQYFDEEIEEDLSILLVKDVTEVRQLENQLKQKEKLAAVGQLAAGIAHEIRNPLAGISGSIQMLSQDAVDPDQKKLMNIVLKEIDRLNNLITEFLDYAKPEKKPDQVVDLKILLEETVQNLKTHKDIKSDMQWNLNLTSQKIIGFSEKLKQCLLNIFINSIQAMKEINKPQISVSLLSENGFVVLSVKDNGSGMSAETQKKMFEPFHTTKPKGTGLGLAITHKILDSHAAQIFVNSEVNEGTEFKIKFPQIGS